MDILIAAVHIEHQKRTCKLRRHSGKKEGIYISKKYLTPAQKCYLTIPEAASYFNIGEKALRRYVKNNADARYITWNGTRALIHRELFEQHMLELESFQ